MDIIPRKDWRAELYLWTIQTEDVWELIQAKGVYRCDPFKAPLIQSFDDKLVGKELDPQLEEAYAWLAEQMTIRIGPAPAGVRFPVWAWYQYDGKRRPDLRKERWTNGSGGERFACIELEVPDDQVLLSDFDNWLCVLGRWAITGSDEEAEKVLDYFGHVDLETEKAFLHENWKRVFDIAPCENDQTGKGDNIQATFWELRSEYVKKVRFFIAGKRKCF